MIHDSSRHAPRQLPRWQRRQLGWPACLLTAVLLLGSCATVAQANPDRCRVVTKSVKDVPPRIAKDPAALVALLNGSDALRADWAYCKMRTRGKAVIAVLLANAAHDVTYAGVAWVNRLSSESIWIANGRLPSTGEVSLYLVEAIWLNGRSYSRYAPHSLPLLFRAGDKMGATTNQAGLHAEAVTRYRTWWETNKHLPVAKLRQTTRPLADTDIYWR